MSLSYIHEHCLREVVGQQGEAHLEGRTRWLLQARELGEHRGRCPRESPHGLVEQAMTIESTFPMLEQSM